MKIVLTGACCGKSTLTNEFRSRGYETMDEVARKILKKYKHNMPVNRGRIQEEILETRLKEEDSLNGNPVFMDRGSVDVLAYSRMYLDKIPDIFYKTDFKNRYDFVFLLDRFPLEKDGIRIEKDDKEAEKIHQTIKSCYIEHGYSPIIVPIFPGDLETSVSRRADFILDYSSPKIKIN